MPIIRRQLTSSQFIADELSELLTNMAREPNESAELPGSDGVSLLRQVRAGRHDEVFDRIVFEFVGDAPSCSISPLSRTQLIAHEAQGDWGLGVTLNPCRVRYGDGPQQSQLSVDPTHQRPDYPALSEFKLASESATACTWVIGCPKAARYLPFNLPDPARIVIDIYRARPA